MNKTLFDAALEWRRRGFKVFPCNADKTPATPHGVKDATTDIATIREWWQTGNAGPMLGVAMGPRVGKPGVVTVDLDLKADANGLEEWKRLGGDYTADTLQQKTPSGGRHLLFLDDPENPLRNSVGAVAPGIDIRAAGGYIIAAPSPGYVSNNAEHIAPLPRFIANRTKAASEEPIPSTATVQEGQRNAYLTRIAGKLVRTGFDLEQIMAMVRAENARLEAPLSDQELRATVFKSAPQWRYMALEESTEEAPHSPEEIKLLPWQTAKEFANMSPPDWLTRDFLERGTTNTIIGKWGSGKSQIMLDYSLRLAIGMDFHGRAHKQRELVVIVESEGHRGFARRISTWCSHHKVDIPENLIVIPQSIPIGEGGEAVLVETLKEIQSKFPDMPLSLLNIDTFARNFGGDSENNNTALANFVNALEYIRAEFPRVTLLVLHHPGHGDQKRGRGGSALPGAVDSDWFISNHEAQVRMECLKNKDGDPGASFHWKLFPIDYLDADGEPFSVICSAEIPIEQVSYTPEFISKKTEDAYVELCKLADESVRKQRAAGREEYHLMITWQDLKDVVNQPKSTWHRTMSELRDGGVIETGSFIRPKGWQPDAPPLP